MIQLIVGIIGILALYGTAFLMSNDKKNINYRAIGIMTGLQIAIAWIMLHTTVGDEILTGISKGFTKLLSFGAVGISFVFAPLDAKYSFIISTLMQIVFISTILGILTYCRILPLAIKYIGGFISKVTGLPKVESFVAVNSMVFGDNSALLSIKSFIPTLRGNRLFIATTAPLVAVSASILGAYMQMLPPKFVLVALPINVFSGLILASMVAPVKKDETTDEEIDIKAMIPEKNIFEAIGNWSMLGGKIALIVAAMLIAYIGLLALVDWVFMSIFHMTFTQMIGYVFAPIAYIMGVNPHELLQAGSIMGTKVCANEFVAMTNFMPMIKHMDHKSVGIVSSFLISFANIGSIGMCLGVIQAISEDTAKEFSKIGMKVLLVATMGSILTGSIVGLFL